MDAAMTFPGELTVADLDRAARDDRWLGFGYLGERQRRREDIAARVAEVDAALIDWANLVAWTYEDLLRWANSAMGRHFGDVTLGSSKPLAYAVSEARQFNLLELPAD